MKHFEKHSKSIESLIDVTEAMLHAMEKHGVDPETVANRTEFYVALSSIIIGVQFFLAGFLGEMLSRNSTSRNNYQIKEKLNLDD